MQTARQILVPKQVMFPGPFKGKWFVPACANDLLYLHTDGVVRHGTLNDQFSGAKGWTGYFKTKEQAESTIAEYRMEIAK